MVSDLTTIEKGKIGELAITSDCIQRGYNVYAPVADCDQVDLLVEIESGVTQNESVSIALQKAIETSVLEIVQQGIERRFWSYE